MATHTHYHLDTHVCSYVISTKNLVPHSNSVNITLLGAWAFSLHHKARAVKKDLKYNIFSLPRSSPDLNPLDFFLWSSVEERMAISAPKGRESVTAYKA
eukprot:2458123-Karenia_brevis.AAC.1